MAIHHLHITHGPCFVRAGHENQMCVCVSNPCCNTPPHLQLCNCHQMDLSGPGIDVKLKEKKKRIYRKKISCSQFFPTTTGQYFSEQLEWQEG